MATETATIELVTWCEATDLGFVPYVYCSAEGNFAERPDVGLMKTRGHLDGFCAGWINQMVEKIKDRFSGDWMFLVHDLGIVNLELQERKRLWKTTEECLLDVGARTNAKRRET